MTGPKLSYARMVEAHDKSVTLGGSLSLFPVQPGLPQAYARTIREAIERAERSAYQQGVNDARRQMRQSLGIGGH